MLDLLGDGATCHLLDLVWFGEFHNQDVPLGGDYEMVVDTYFLSQDGHLDDAALREVLPEVHVGCGLLVVLYGGLMQELHFHGPVTFGLVTLVCASETASSEILRVVEILHLAKVGLQRLAYSVEQGHLALSSSTFCISTVYFETKFLPEIMYDIVIEVYS